MRKTHRDDTSGGRSGPAWRCALLIAGALTGLFAAPGYAQTSDDSLRTARNTVFLELGGSGLLYSLNAERLVSPRVGVRGGVSTFGFGHITDSVLFPVTVSVLMGPDGDGHRIEVGMGLTPAVDRTSWRVGVLGTALVGFRYQPPGGGAFMRFALVPLVSPTDGDVGLSAGFAFGYSF